MEDESVTVAVVGPGAIGGTVAAWLARNRRLAVTVAVRTPFKQLVLETLNGTISADIPLLTDPTQAKIVDWVLIATKAYDEVATKAWLAGLVGSTTRIAVLQNGVEHVARFADAVPVDRILPVVVDVGAERIAAGRIRQKRSGTMIVPAGPHGDAFQALFDKSPIQVSTTDDFVTAVWTKLASNCTGVLNALLDKPAGIAVRDDIAVVIRALVQECMLVGRAQGAILDDRLPDRVITSYRSGPANAVNSLYADFAAGRPMELDARNRVIIRLGAHHGIPTPMHELMVTLISAAADLPSR